MSIYEFSPPPVAVGGVTSLNSLTGALSLLAGTNITLTPSGNSLTIDAAATSSSGAAGSVQFSDGASGFASDGAAFFWDNTNKRLGLGMNTPAWDLDILAVQPYAINAVATGSNDILFRTTATGHSAVMGVSHLGPAFFGSESNDDVLLRSNNMTRVTISAAGAVQFNTGYTAGIATFDASGNITSVPGGGGTPSDFIFTNSSAQTSGGTGPACIVDSILATTLSVYYGSADVPLGDTTHDSVDTVLQTGFILEPTSTMQSKDISVESGQNRGLGATGTINIFSGGITNAASTAITGDSFFSSGNTAGSGTTGKVAIFSGSSSSGASGNIEITPGPAATTRGKIVCDNMVLISAAFNENWDGPGGGVLVDSVANATNSVAYFGSTDIPVGDTTHSGNYTAIKSGAILETTSTNSSGQMQIVSGDNFGLGQTGDVYIHAGSLYNAANNTTPGNVSIGAGNSKLAAAGGVLITSGSSVGSTAGDISLAPSDGVTNTGNIVLAGPIKLSGSQRVNINSAVTSYSLNSVSKSAFKDNKLILNDSNVLNTNTITLPVGADGMTFTTKATAANLATWVFAASGGNTIDAPGGSPPDPAGSIQAATTLTFLTGVWYVI